MKEIFMYEKNIPNGGYCCDFRDHQYNHCIASKESDEYMSCNNFITGDVEINLSALNNFAKTYGVDVFDIFKQGGK